MAVVLAFIAVGAAFSVVAITRAGLFDPIGALSVSVVNSNGQPVSNVSVQGLMAIPTSDDGGFRTVFLGITGSNGMYSTTNYSAARNVVDEWSAAVGADTLSYSYPAILVFATYTDQSGTYFTETSIDLSPSQIIAGKSAGTTAVLYLSRKPLLPNPEETATGNMEGPSPGIPHPTSSYNYYWVQVNASYTPVEEIPTAWIWTNIYAYGCVLTTIIDQQETSWNVGAATGIDGVTADIGHIAGGTIWQSTENYQNFWVTGYPNPLDGYIYINGTVEGALFREYYRNPYMCGRFGVDCAVPTNNYQYDVGIVNVSANSQGIVGGGLPGNPPYLSQITKNFTMTYFNDYTGEGSSPQGPNQTIYNLQFVKYFSDNDTGWINIGVDVGAILVATLTAADIAIPPLVALSLVGTVSGSTTGSIASLSNLEFDAPKGYGIDVYVAVDNVNYTLSNGYTGQIPLMGTEVLGFPPQGGGGGCVLGGTEIALANGTSIAVQDLRPGMELLSYDTSTDAPTAMTVYSINSTTVPYIIEVNHQLALSGLGDQPVFVRLSNGTTGFVDLGYLNYSMELFDPLNSSWIPITSITLLNGNFTVYDITVSAHSTSTSQFYATADYVANGFLVAIKKDPDVLQMQ